MNDLLICKEMEEVKDKIETFPLETDKGTKRLKQKFYHQAVAERNKYIEKQIPVYENYLSFAKKEIGKRYDKLMPSDVTPDYEKAEGDASNLLKMVFLKSNCSDSFKLGIDYIISSIEEDTSLEQMNLYLDSYLKRFGELSITLDIHDFCYTMFTEQYMKAFFENSNIDVMRGIFENIFFQCPDIKNQIKMNLKYIVVKYQDALKKAVNDCYQSMLKDYSIANEEVIPRYIEYRLQLGERMATDEFYNANEFLSGKRKIDDYLENSAMRNKIFNQFAYNEDYLSLTEHEKDIFYTSIMGFYLTLNELKKYYDYEFIIQELLSKYKNKDSAKNNYLAKKKEIDKAESEREKLYKNYLKSSGIGFLAKKNTSKMKNIMLQMNDQVKKLSSLYEEFYESEITYQLSMIDPAASIYDLFKTSFMSFPFLEKSFKTNEKYQDRSLEDVIVEYLRFLYNPNNQLLRKIPGLVEYDIASIVAEKYKLLGLNVTSDAISPDGIESTFEAASTINFIQNVEQSKISFSMISLLCSMKAILDENESK